MDYQIGLLLLRLHSFFLDRVSECIYAQRVRLPQRYTVELPTKHLEPFRLATSVSRVKEPSNQGIFFNQREVRGGRELLVKHLWSSLIFTTRRIRT